MGQGVQLKRQPDLFPKFFQNEEKERLSLHPQCA